MLRLAWISLLLIGCSTASSQPAATVEFLPTAIRFRAGHHAPCRIVTGEDVEIFTYGDRRECLLPLDMVETGIFGCLTGSHLAESPDNGTSYGYDAQGRLSSFDHDEYRWQGERWTTAVHAG